MSLADSVKYFLKKINHTPALPQSASSVKQNSRASDAELTGIDLLATVASAHSNCGKVRGFSRQPDQALY